MEMFCLLGIRDTVKKDRSLGIVKCMTLSPWTDWSHFKLQIWVKTPVHYPSEHLKYQKDGLVGWALPSSKNVIALPRSKPLKIKSTKQYKQKT